MDRPFRIGIVGAGMITGSSHLPQAMASPLAEVVALVDPVEERARSLARAYGIKPRISSRVEDVLDGLDGAIIATPNHTHKDLALKCLAKGIPVLIEKPLATTVADGERIAAAAKEAGVVAAVGYSTRFDAYVQWMGKLIAQRYFGAIRRFVCQVGTAGGWAPLSSYNLSREQSGGGVLVVTGSHFLDRMLAWFGYPDGVEYYDDSLGGPEANCVACFTFDSKDHRCAGEARFSKTTALRTGLVMDTEAGMVFFQDGRAPLLRPAAAPAVELSVGKAKALPELPQKETFQLQVEDFIRACQGRCAPLVSAEQGVTSLRLIEALYASRRPLEERSMDEVRR